MCVCVCVCVCVCASPAQYPLNARSLTVYRAPLITSLLRTHPSHSTLSHCASARVFHTQVYKYFSYEHFYVIYCKFWELDTDHDFLLDSSDLAKYSQCALSLQIIDRIFAQVRGQGSTRHAGTVACLARTVVHIRTSKGMSAHSAGWCRVEGGVRAGDDMPGRHGC